MGPGDIFQTLFGRPPAEAQLAASLGQAPGQPGSPQGPQPLAGQNAPPGGPAGPGGSPDPSGGPAAPQQQQQAPPTPQAYQSTPDMAQMFLALSQQNQAKQDFWGGLAGVAQALHPGRVTPGMVKSITGTSQDAGSMFNNYMQLQAWQQQNTRYNDLFNNSDKYAASFGVDPDMFKATIAAAGPQGAGQILGRIAEAQMGLTGTQTDKEYKQAMKPGVWGSTPDSQDAQGNPLPKPTEAAWDQMQRDKMTADKLETTRLAGDRGNFQPALQTYDEHIAQMNELLDPKNEAALKELTGWWNAKLKNPMLGGGNLSTDAQRLKTLYTTLMASQFASAVQDFPGSRISTKELLTDAPSKSTMDLAQDYPDFLRSAGDYREQLLNHRSNLFGKTGQLSDPSLTDADYDRISPIYKQGGSLYAKGQPLRQLSDNDLAEAQKRIAGGDTGVIPFLKSKGYDISKLGTR